MRSSLTGRLFVGCAGGVLYDGRGTYNDVIGYAERLFSRIRQTVSGWLAG
jgi:hypothetical protein